jgi:hypothetical protein
MRTLFQPKVLPPLPALFQHYQLEVDPASLRRVVLLRPGHGGDRGKEVHVSQNRRMDNIFFFNGVTKMF